MKTSTFLPVPGQITRKRRRHWKRHILRAHPGISPVWLDTIFEVGLILNGDTFDPIEYAPRARRYPLLDPADVVFPFPSEHNAENAVQLVKIFSRSR